MSTVESGRTNHRRSAPRAGTARKGAPVEVAGIAISHPDKLFYPEARVSKLDVARYYAAVGARMLPHLRQRPLSLLRCPDGRSGECFFQKHAQSSVSDAVTRIEAPEARGSATYLSANSVTALVALAQWGVVELHPWGARKRALHCPDRLIFDFDPGPDVSWRDLVAVVRACRELLEHLELACFLKTTGGKGLHIVVPIRPTLDWAAARSFTKGISDTLAHAAPDRIVTSAAAKAARKGKIFIDYLRNTQGSTAVAPYSLRARENAPVATPIEWDELASDVRFDHFNLKNVPGRLTRMKRDPWAEMATTRCFISAAMQKSIGHHAE
jgi:bifunctional non-homologous end joining protein LigD